MPGPKGVKGLTCGGNEKTGGVASGGAAEKKQRRGGERKQSVLVSCRKKTGGRQRSQGRDEEGRVRGKNMRKPKNRPEGKRWKANKAHW